MKVIQKGNDLLLENVKDFDIEQTLECGQCFHFVKLSLKEYALSAKHKLLHIKQENDKITFFNTSKQEYDNIWEEYFDIKRDYGRIKNTLIKEDEKLRTAIEMMGGVRILNQDFFETLISFIISQNKQIPHIKKIVADISKKYGDYLGEIGNEEFYSFPDVHIMHKVTEENLRECKTGFRAPYICDAVDKIYNGIIIEEKLKKMDADECANELMKIKGVGSKVANCVMLFGLGIRSAFPVDVWIKRIMESVYFEGKDMPKDQIENFGKEHFREYGGYAQQYLFYYGKTIKVKKAK